jgi:hypothetical protein
MHTYRNGLFVSNEILLTRLDGTGGILHIRRFFPEKCIAIAMDYIRNIQDIIDGIEPDERNREGGIFLNSVKNEFITFPGTITVPKISVKELAYDRAVGVVEGLRMFFPEFFIHHRILAKRKPEADVHSIQFMRPLQGEMISFVHFFKIDLRFGGDSSSVVEKGDTANYPSYLTNRMYYKSRIVPAEVKGDDFSAIRLLDSIDVSSDMRRHTFAMFDEVSMKEVNKTLQEYIDQRIFSTSQQLYPFFVFDFFTPCLNIPHPTEEELTRGIELFEPVFLYLQARYRGGVIGNAEQIVEKFPSAFVLEKDTIALSEHIIGVMKTYFSRYTIVRDDELALRGWWKLEVAPLKK